ncbi:MAG TPA: hypothetical protein VKZ50_04405 [bacterium]|nr:hypothetical protein [bacterium]
MRELNAALGGLLFTALLMTVATLGTRILWGVATLPELIDGGSRLAWVMWVLTWTLRQAGEYRPAGRAVDGTCAVQARRVRRSAPEGATGHHRVVARVQ